MAIHPDLQAGAELPASRLGDGLEPEAGELVASAGSEWRRIARGLVSTPTSLIGAVLLVLFACVALAAPQLAPCPDGPAQRPYCLEDPYTVAKFGFDRQPKPPFTLSESERYGTYVHRFGTTPDQRDIYYGVVWGTRTAFQVGILVTLTTLIMGVGIGSVAAYYGGWTDEVLMRIVEVVMAFPFLLAAITLATILRTNPDLGQGTLPAMIALIAFGWTGYSRLVRADILSIKQREYVWASRSLGASDFRIITRHILPNSIFPVLVVASLDIGAYVLSFAALSFLGVGVPEGFADWGQMISGARERIGSITDDWFIVLFPGLAITLFVLAWNLLGDAFRDLLDPRLTHGKA
jgi:peptide/nickel transport system permease protein